MKTKFFTRSGSFWKTEVNVAALEAEINDWLAAHPAIKVVATKHAMASGMWSYSQLVVTIYYEESH